MIQFTLSYMLISQKTKMLTILQFIKSYCRIMNLANCQNPDAMKNRFLSCEMIRIWLNCLMQLCEQQQQMRVPFNLRKMDKLSDIKRVDRAFAARYQIPKDIDWTDDELHTVIFYFKSNKCFKQKHHCTSCRAKIKPKVGYESFTEPTTIDVIHCNECDKYFVTKEIFIAKGGCWKYYVSAEFDPSMSSQDRELATWASYYSSKREIFDDFAQRTSINNDGYTTTKPATQRQKLLRYFIDSGKYTEGEIIQYFHEQYLDTGWHGAEATQKVRNDLNYLLDYCTELKTIDAKLERP